MIKQVSVIGAGLMGSGIVQIAAQNGFKTVMIDTSSEALLKGKQQILKSLERISKKANDLTIVEKAMNNISTATTIDACNSSDLVIEAIVENLQVKHKLFKNLDLVTKHDAIFASNTSSLRIQDIAQVTNRMDKFVGLHFFNPVPQMKLVEIIKLKETLPQVFDNVVEFSKKVGKTPVTCKDTPGLLVPYLMEAIRMVERGDCTKEDVDVAMKLGAGYPMGPFELADYVGLDTTKFITDGWYTNSSLKGEKLVAPSEMLNKLVGDKKLGRKSGQGFYTYSK